MKKCVDTYANRLKLVVVVVGGRWVLLLGGFVVVGLFFCCWVGVVVGWVFVVGLLLFG